MKATTAFSIILIIISFSSVSKASLITIGTTNYNGQDYNLIWDDDNNGKSVIWFDYTTPTQETWQDMVDWAANLDSNLSNILTPGYSIVWNDNTWRLPDMKDGPYVWGSDGTTTKGFNITSSEMGHLYYDELGNLGSTAIDGSYPQPGWGLNNTGDFNNLLATWYWSDLEYNGNPGWAWRFLMYNGAQEIGDKNGPVSAIAIRTGQVSIAAVPEPVTMILFGLGLLGLAGVSRRK